MRWVVVVCAVAGWGHAQDALDPQVLLLSKIRDRAIENLQRQPNYTCVETVERSHRLGTTKKFQLIDTLRLEVGLVDGKEMFGWPGAKKFDVSDLTDIVTEGAIGNGDFALHSKALFEGQSAMFTYHGEEMLGDRASVRFDYRVPLMMSGYTLHAKNVKASVGYHGAVYADPKSLDVQRIEVQADDIPLALQLSDASDRVDYARTAIGGGQFLLPEASELKLTDLNGLENVNRIRFASCRQFTGESVLTFGDAPSLGSAPARATEIELPAKMSFQLMLLDDLDTRTAAVGDPVRARLQNDLKEKGHVWFAKGAVASGRITRLETHSDNIVVGMEFSEIESAGSQARLTLSVDLPWYREAAQSNRQNEPPVGRPGEIILQVRSDRYILQHGTLMFWRTS